MQSRSTWASSRDASRTSAELTRTAGRNTLSVVPPSPLSPVEITLAGMRFHVRVGILPHERQLPQALEVDLVVRLIAQSGAVLDYRALYQAVHDAVSLAPIEYLETAAEEIASRILLMDDVEWCRVAMRKPNVTLAGPLAYAQVAVERGRV